MFYAASMQSNEYDSDELLPASMRVGLDPPWQGAPASSPSMPSPLSSSGTLVGSSAPPSRSASKHRLATPQRRQTGQDSRGQPMPVETPLRRVSSL